VGRAVALLGASALATFFGDEHKVHGSKTGRSLLAKLIASGEGAAQRQRADRPSWGRSRRTSSCDRQRAVSRGVALPCVTAGMVKRPTIHDVASAAGVSVTNAWRSRVHWR
jgi:hypothetical protein